MLKSSFSGEVMIFAKEYNGKTYYQYGVSKKKQDGTYLNGYLDCSFRKGVNVPNKTKITITKGWLDFYINKDKHTVAQIFISEFETEAGPQYEGFAQLEDPDSIPF